MNEYLKKIRPEQWFLIGWLVLFLALALVPLSVSAKGRLITCPNRCFLKRSILCAPVRATAPRGSV